jgi:hypothetical protein
MGGVILAAVVYAVWRALKNSPDAAKKDVTLKSAEATQRVVLWTLAAVLALALLNSMGGI